MFVIVQKWPSTIFNYNWGVLSHIYIYDTTYIYGYIWGYIYKYIYPDIYVGNYYYLKIWKTCKFFCDNNNVFITTGSHSNPNLSFS